MNLLFGLAACSEELDAAIDLCDELSLLGCIGQTFRFIGDAKCVIEFSRNKFRPRTPDCVRVLEWFMSALAG